MKQTEYVAKKFNKNDTIYTKFMIGNKCFLPRLKSILTLLNAEITKQNNTYTQYEVEGDKLYLLML